MDGEYKDSEKISALVNLYLEYKEKETSLLALKRIRAWALWSGLFSLLSFFISSHSAEITLGTVGVGLILFGLKDIRKKQVDEDISIYSSCRTAIKSDLKELNIEISGCL